MSRRRLLLEVECAACGSSETFTLSRFGATAESEAADAVVARGWQRGDRFGADSADDYCPDCVEELR